jgi:hypothetical protein
MKLIAGGLTEIDVKWAVVTVVAIATGANPDGVMVIVVVPEPLAVITPDGLMDATVGSVTANCSGPVNSSDDPSENCACTLSDCVRPSALSCTKLGVTVTPVTVRRGVIGEQLVAESPPAARTDPPERAARNGSM